MPKAAKGADGYVALSYDAAKCLGVPGAQGTCPLPARRGGAKRCSG
ncbi:MAG: hypothetical protein FWF71_04150 [Actinomycetia bacterium]|nr:hypothetical protein [Actinomycetes bacterium]